MIEEVIENIDINFGGIWLKGHIYITDDDSQIIWSHASSPLHDCPPESENMFTTFRMVGRAATLKKNTFGGIGISLEQYAGFTKRRQIAKDGILSVRIYHTPGKRNKGVSELIIQTFREDILLRGKDTDVNRLRRFFPQPEEVKEEGKKLPFYFYMDGIAINQLFSQTPEGDIVEVLREAGAKIGGKGKVEFGNQLISKLSLELSSELSEKTIVKTQPSDMYKIAAFTMYLAAHDQALDIMNFNLRKIPAYLYFDSQFEFSWSLDNGDRESYELIAETGLLKVRMPLDENCVVHNAILKELVSIEEPKIQGLAKTNVQEGIITLIPIYLAS